MSSERPSGPLPICLFSAHTTATEGKGCATARDRSSNGGESEAEVLGIGMSRVVEDGRDGRWLGRPPGDGRSDGHLSGRKDAQNPTDGRREGAEICR
jgi:hypothetical protein